MSQRGRESRIADNPSAKAMSALMPLVKAVKAITGAMKGHGVKNETVDQIHQSATDVLRQSDVWNLPDRFNDAFADEDGSQLNRSGWRQCTEPLNCTTRAISKAQSRKS